MKRVPLLLFLLSSLSLGDEITAYKVGFVDGFTVGYALREASKVNIPSGYWVIKDLWGAPTPVVGFYAFIGKKEGFDVKFTPEGEIVFGVYSRKADALFAKDLLEQKGIRGIKVERRSSAKGYDSFLFRSWEIFPEKCGVSLDSSALEKLKKFVEEE